MFPRLLFVTALAATTVFRSASAETPTSNVVIYDVAYFAVQRPNTAYDMVIRVPGFTFNAGTTARGYSGTAGNVLVNGERPTSKSDGLDSILARIPASDVDHVELIRGGAPGIDMQGQTVVVNIVRKNTDSTSITATAEAVLFEHGRIVPIDSLEITQHTGDRLYEGSISTVSTFEDATGGGSHDIFDANGVLLRHDLARHGALGIGVAGKGAATFHLMGGEFKANLTLQDSPNISHDFYESSGLRQLFINKSRDNVAELGLHWQRSFGAHDVEALLLQRLGTSTELDTSNDKVTLQNFSSRSSTGESIARLVERYRALDTLAFEGSVEAAYNFLDGKTAFDVDGIPVPLPAADAKVTEKRGEISAQATWKLSNFWLLEAGARLEYSLIDANSDTRVSRSFLYAKPSAILTWTPDDKTQVRLRYERVVGQLDFNNFIASSNLASTGVTAGNINLRPDQRSQYELSVERDFWNKGAVVLTLRHEQIQDAVDFVPVFTPTSTFDAPGNIGNGRNDVITLALTVPLDDTGLSGGLLHVDNTWQFSDVRDPTTGTHRVISSERPLDLQIKLTQDIDSWKSTWAIVYLNGWTEDSFRLTQTRQRRASPPYFGAYWEYKPTPTWSLHFEIDNIVPFVYKDVRFNSLGPRNIFSPSSTEVLKIQSQPMLDIQIRKTFD